MCPGKIATIITATCRHPINNLGALTKTLQSVTSRTDLRCFVIAFDGYQLPPQNTSDFEALHPRCRKQCNETDYSQYRNHAEKTLCKDQALNCRFISLPKRQCLTGVLHAVLPLVETTYVNIMQEGLAYKDSRIVLQSIAILDGLSRSTIAATIEEVADRPISSNGYVTSLSTESRDLPCIIKFPICHNSLEEAAMAKDCNLPHYFAKSPDPSHNASAKFALSQANFMRFATVGFTTVWEESDQNNPQDTGHRQTVRFSYKLTRSFGFSDQNHLAITKLYKRFIEFTHKTHPHSFPEETMRCVDRHPSFFRHCPVYYFDDASSGGNYLDDFPVRMVL